MGNSQKIYAIWTVVNHEREEGCRYARGLSAATRIAAEEMAALARFDASDESPAFEPYEAYVVMREIKIEGDE